MNGEPIYEVALAIYSTFVRERDPDRARRRFNNLKPAIREQYEAEARAASRVCEAYLQGAFAA